MVRENKIIEILEYASKQENGFKLKKLKEDLELTTIEFKLLLKEISHNNIFFTATDGMNESSNEFSTKEYWENRTDMSVNYHDSITYYLSLNGFAQMNEYYDLKESRENAISAQKNAKIAMWISIVTLLISIAFTIYYGETIQSVNIIEPIFNSSILI